LVVIGIIALLISVLLPALGKARQQANLVDCMSRLRQMGQALSIYAAENGGLLPYGDVKYDVSGGPSGTPWLAGTTQPTGEESWYWDFTLSQEVQANILGPDRLVHNLSPMFHDVDTIDVTYGRYVNHYTCNPKIFPNNYDNSFAQDGTVTAPQFVRNRKFGNIKPSTAFMFWDAPQVFDWDPGVGNNAYEQATAIDCNAEAFDSYLFNNTNILPSVYSYVRPALPGDYFQSYGQGAVSRCLLQQKEWNIDISAAVSNAPSFDYFLSHIRYRHMNNTVLNALCVDGHVESRALGTLLVTDVCINSPG